jgi:hypothetical protein
MYHKSGEVSHGLHGHGQPPRFLSRVRLRKAQGGFFADPNRFLPPEAFVGNLRASRFRSASQVRQPRPARRGWWFTLRQKSFWNLKSNPGAAGFDSSLRAKIASPESAVERDPVNLYWQQVTLTCCFYGGGGNRTRVRKRSVGDSTCVSGSDLVVSRPEGTCKPAGTPAR